MIAPGTCRHCNCTELNACRLEDGDPCSWTDGERTVCSNPKCIVAEQQRRARIKAEFKASQPRKLRSWEIEEQRKQKRLARARESRLRRKGRAA